jgi:nucleoside-diphosphate-sugar epimerase
MAPLTVAITGAAGFLGRTLTPVLRDDPAVGRVIALDLARGETEGVE